jgi:hypothetical protein
MDLLDDLDDARRDNTDWEARRRAVEEWEPPEDYDGDGDGDGRDRDEDLDVDGEIEDYAFAFSSSPMPRAAP